MWISNTRITRLLSVFAILILVVVGCAPATIPTPATSLPRNLETPTSATATPKPSATEAPTLSPSVTPRPLTPQPTLTQTPNVNNSPKYGGLLTIASVGDPPSLDAQQESTINTAMVVGPAYDTLLEYASTPNHRIVPSLAESWEMSADGLQYVLRVRKGVSFHDGSSLTRDDVIFNLERMKSPPKGILSNVAFLLDSIQSIKPEGDQDIRLTLKEPFAALPVALAIDYAPIYPKQAVEKLGDMKTTVLGTGPFKFVRYNPGSMLELTKNSNYWFKGRPYLDGVRFYILRDEATRLAAFRTGRVLRTARIFGALTPSQVSQLEKETPDTTFRPGASLTGPAIFLNTKASPFNNPMARLALSLSLDRQAAIKVLDEGRGRLASLFPWDEWGLPDSELLKLPGYGQPKQQDRQRARELFQNTGIAKGQPLTILSRTNDVTRAGATFMASQLQEVGVDARVELLDDATFFGRGRSQSFQAMVFTPTSIISDPVWMGRLWAPKGSLNYTGNDDDPKLKSLWDEQRRTVDVAKRQSLTRELERYMLGEQLSVVPIAWPYQFDAARGSVREPPSGPTALTGNNLRDVWLSP